MAHQIIQSFRVLERTLGFVLSRIESHWMILSSRGRSYFPALCTVHDKMGMVETGDNCCFLQAKGHCFEPGVRT